MPLLKELAFRGLNNMALLFLSCMENTIFFSLTILLWDLFADYTASMGCPLLRGSKGPFSCGFGYI